MYGQRSAKVWLPRVDIFRESTACGLGDCDRHLRVELQLWECVGGIMGAGRREREM